MKIAILGKMERTYEEIRLIEEAKKVFDSVVYMPVPQVHLEVESGEFRIKYKNNDLSNFDCVLPRIPRSYRTFGFTILSALKGQTYVPIEPMSLFNSHNKFLTLLVFKEAGLPIPKTFLSIKRNVLENLLDEIGYPIVMKLLYGSQGQGVMFADSKESAVSFMDALERFKQPIFLEKFVENPGEDIRAYVVGYEVIACMKRVAKENEKRANIGIGGKGVKYHMSKEYAHLAIRAAKSLGMSVCGIDLIEGEEGPMLIEANVNAQFKGLEETSGKNVARAIIEHMKQASG